jgi:hypothetical protein
LQLLNTAELTIDGGAYRCDSYETGCSAFFPTHPVYAQPFLPIIPINIFSKMFSWLQVKALLDNLVPTIYIQQDYELLYPHINKNQVKYFVPLSSIVNGTLLRFYSSSAIDFATFAIIGTLYRVFYNTRRGT